MARNVMESEQSVNRQLVSRAGRKTASQIVSTKKGPAATIMVSKFQIEFYGEFFCSGGGVSQYILSMRHSANLVHCEVTFSLCVRVTPKYCCTVV